MNSITDPLSPLSNFAVIDRENPWPGLAPFTEDQSGFFHGRDAEIRALARLMERKALTVLFGQSGLGKSSLLMAGVFPRLRSTSFCPIYLRLDHGDGAPTPSEQVKAMVADATARAGTWTKPGTAKPGESLWEFFHHRDDRLVDAGGRTIVPVLVFDQFEELFTLGAAAGAQRDRAVAFMSELAELVENRPSEQLVARLEHSADEMDAFDFSRTDYRVCIALREDYLPHLEGLKTIMPALMENRMRLARMTGVQALEAVVKPGGALVTPEVAQAIVEFVSGARGGSAERLAELDVEPPLLSVICRELNERRRALGQAQITADLVSGNRREILNDFYERSVGDLPEGMRTFVEDHLLTKSGFRDNLALETALEFPGVTRPLVDTLVSRRLLRIEDRLGVQRVELTHDVLAEVIRASRDGRRQREVQLAARQHARRQRWVIAGLAAAVVALCIGTAFGLRAKRRATEHASRGDLLLGSRLLDDGKLTEGLAYLVSAAQKDPGNRLLAPRILTTLAAHNFSLPWRNPLALPSPFWRGIYSPDGRRIWVQSEDDVVRVIDAREWRFERELKFEQKIRRNGIRWAEKNTGVFAAMLMDGTILIYDSATGSPREPALRPPANVKRSTSFHLSPDGRWVATNNDNKISLWEVASGELRATLPHGDNYFYSYAFSADSRRLVTTHGAKITQMWSVPGGTPVGQPIQGPTSRWTPVPKFSQDGRRLELVYEGTGVLICDADTGVPIRPLLPLDSAVWNVLLTLDGGRMVYASDRAVHVIEVATGKPAFPPLIHGGPVRDLDFAGEGRTLFTNCVDGLFRLWDIETGKLLAEPTFKQEQYTPAVVAPDGKTVAVFAHSGLVYPLRTGGGAAAPLVLPRHPAKTILVNFMAQAPTRLFWCTPTEVRAIDVASGRDVAGGFALPAQVPTLRRSTYGGTAGAGLTFFAPTAADTWRAWRLGERGVVNDVPLEGLRSLISGTSAATIVASFGYSPTGNLGAYLFGEGEPKALGIWSLQSGRRVTSIKPTSPVRRENPLAEFSPDEKRVAYQTLVDRAVHVCEVAGGKELFVLRLTGRPLINAFRFSPNGTQLFTGDTWGSVQVWDAASGTLLRSTQAHRTYVTRFDFSEDGRYYASMSVDGSVQVWETATNVRIGAPLLQEGTPTRVSFSPDNERIITPSSGGTARIWDVRTGLPLTEPLNHEGDPAVIVAYSPDGRFVSTSQRATAAKGAQRVWSAPPDSRGAHTPKWLLQFATICAGQRLADNGNFASAADEFAKIEELRAEIAAQPDNDPYAEWARWILSDSPTRSIAPGFTITPAEAKKLRETFLSAGGN